MSEVNVEVYVETEFSSSTARRCQAPAASISEPAPGPVWMSVEVTSGGC